MISRPPTTILIFLAGLWSTLLPPAGAQDPDVGARIYHQGTLPSGKPLAASIDGARLGGLGAPPGLLLRRLSSP